MTTKSKQTMDNEAMQAAFAAVHNDGNIGAIETILVIADNNGWLWNAVRSSALFSIGNAFLMLDDLKGRQTLNDRQAELVQSLERQIDENTNLALWAQVEHIDRDVPRDYRASLEDTAQFVSANRANREVEQIQEGLKLMKEVAGSPAELEVAEQAAKDEIEAVKLLGADNRERVLKFLKSQMNSKMPAAFEVSDRTAFYVINRLYNWIDKRASTTEVMTQLRNAAPAARASIVAEMKLAQAIHPQVKTIFDKYEKKIEGAGNDPVGETH